jgi:DNA segregation ATPase FtsK/SpoIIIE-like protein
VIKLVVKTPNEGELETICTREYDEANFMMPEPKNVVSIPSEDGEEDTRYYVENVIHRLADDQPELQLVVRDEETVLRQVREQRQQQMRQMQQMQQAQGQGKQGGNPFSGGGNSGGDSPFSI